MVKEAAGRERARQAGKERLGVIRREKRAVSCEQGRGRGRRMREGRAELQEGPQRKCPSRWKRNSSRDFRH
eukprot:2438861-Rhodomonas_salina.5